MGAPSGRARRLGDALEALVPPALALTAVAGIATAGLAWATGGRELADDALPILAMVRHPWALFGDYRAIGINADYASYPPLLPALYGIGIRPWLGLLTPFWALRVGVLGWTLALLGGTAGVARAAGTTSGQTRRALWLLAALPSTVAAIAINPQEESYVALFAVALYLAAAAGRFGLVLPLLCFTMLAGKYFLLIAVIPLALASPRPLRNALVWLCSCVGLLAVYVLYHAVWHESATPIVSHLVDAAGSISVWALLWQLGVRPDPGLAELISVPLSGALALAVCLAMRRKGSDLATMMAAALLATLLSLSITFPGYVLWALPFAVVSLARLRTRAERLAGVALLTLWGVGEWGANLFRGIELALRSLDTASKPSGAGKLAFAHAMESWLGPHFPFHTALVAMLVTVLVSGVGLMVLLWRVPGRRGARRPFAEHRLRRRVAGAAFVAVAALAAAEGAVRIAGVAPPAASFERRAFDRVVGAEPLPDSGALPSSRTRGILILGDEALGRGSGSLAAMLSARFRAVDGPEVLDATVPGSGTPDQRARARSLLPRLRPKAVVVGFNLQNDPLRNAALDGSASLGETEATLERRLRGEIATRLAKLSGFGLLRGFALWGYAPRLRSELAGRPWVVESSRRQIADLRDQANAVGAELVVLLLHPSGSRQRGLRQAWLRQRRLGPLYAQALGIPDVDLLDTGPLLDRLPPGSPAARAAIVEALVDRLQRRDPASILRRSFPASAPGS